MDCKIVTIPITKTLIKKAPGFAKKQLADYKVDIVGLCGFGCRYCSSNTGNYLRIYRQQFAALTEEQLGDRLLPTERPELMFVYDDVVEHLRRELHGISRNWGTGKVLVFSMLTDAFSPFLVERGITEQALATLVESTGFTIRVLTKNAIVGSDAWIEFFLRHRDRFVVGLSCGTLDDDWARRVELGTSSPTERLAALRRLQDAGVRTFGMLCPVFPDALDQESLDELVSRTNPNACEDIWAEPFNDRQNWRVVRDGYQPGSAGYEWLTQAFERRRGGEWSAFATQLYVTMRLKAEAEGWLEKMKFMLYEKHVEPEHARSFCDLRGLLLKSPGDKSGLSKNQAFRTLQTAIEPLNQWDRIGSPYVDKDGPSGWGRGRCKR